MQLFDGRHYAQELDQLITTHLSTTNSRTLALIQIGDDAASSKYISIKEKLCLKFGIPVEVIKITADLPDEEITAQVEKIINAIHMNSVLIQLPLPRISLNILLDKIPSEKDVDVLSSKSREGFFAGDANRLPPVVSAVKHFLELQKLTIKDLEVAIIGEGFLVGKPVGSYLTQNGACVSYIDNFDSTVVLDADLVISATGVANLLKGENIKNGASVIDFGFPGDLDMQSNLNHLKTVVPAVGGMGPLVVRFLLLNHLATYVSIQKS